LPIKFLFLQKSWLVSFYCAFTESCKIGTSNPNLDLGVILQKICETSGRLRLRSWFSSRAENIL